MKILLHYLKYLILAIILIAMLIGLGSLIINDISDIELRKSTYTRTEFDYHIAAPSKEQISELEKDSSIKSIFPYYAFSKAFSKNDKIMLLVSDDMKDHSASLLTEGTLIEGEFNKSGAMLDKTAADALGVSVGDKISFTLLGKRVTKTVSAIYLPSTLAIMEKGIVSVELTSDIEGSIANNSYGGAFIIANDKDGAASLLNGYAGEGNVTLTYEQYVKLNCGNKLPNQTDKEYENLCKSKYEAYRKDVLDSARKDGGQVVDKMEAYSLLQEKVLTTEKKASNLKLLTAIATFAIFVIATIVFSVTNISNDRILRDEGMHFVKMWLSHSLTAVITAVLASGISLLVLNGIANGTFFKAELISVILFVCLPTLIAIVPALIASLVYVWILYRA